MIKVYSVLFILFCELSFGYASSAVHLISHRLEEGQTITDIAERYHTSLETITAYNPFLLTAGIRVGQSLRVPIEQVAEIYASKEKKEQNYTNKEELPRLLYKEQALINSYIPKLDQEAYRDVYSIEKAQEDINSKKSFVVNLSVVFNDGSSIILNNQKQLIELLNSLAME